MTDYTKSKNKRNDMTKSLLSIILLVTSFLTASLLVGVISSIDSSATAVGANASAIGGNASAIGGNASAIGGNASAIGGNHTNNQTSASGNISSMPGTSQLEDRRHAPV
jgi:hypothetical protein